MPLGELKWLLSFSHPPLTEQCLAPYSVRLASTRPRVQSLPAAKHGSCSEREALPGTKAEMDSLAAERVSAQADAKEASKLSPKQQGKRKAAIASDHSNTQVLHQNPFLNGT